MHKRWDRWSESRLVPMHILSYHVGPLGSPEFRSIQGVAVEFFTRWRVFRPDNKRCGQWRIFPRLRYYNIQDRWRRFTYCYLLVLYRIWQGDFHMGHYGFALHFELTPKSTFIFSLKVASFFTIFPTLNIVGTLNKFVLLYGRRKINKCCTNF